jgi:hypothetical protein
MILTISYSDDDQSNSIGADLVVGHEEIIEQDMNITGTELKRVSIVTEEFLSTEYL